MKTDEKTLLVVFDALLEAFKKGLAENVYQIFPPDKIEVHDEEKVQFEAKNGAPNLREGLRLLGVTLYHLAAGESELNKTSYQIDGYLNRPLNSEFWPLISLLLSGSTFSVPQVEEMAKSGRRIAKKERMTKQKQVLLSKLALLKTSICQIFLCIIPAYYRLCFYMVNSERVQVGVILAGIIEVIWYWKFNWPFSNGFGMFLLSALFALAVGFVYWVTYDEGATSSLSEELRQIERRRHLPRMVMIMALYAGTSFFSSTTAGGSGDAILVKRDTGEFVARVGIPSSDRFFAWDRWLINHFKYKVVSGVYLNGTTEEIIRINDDTHSYDLKMGIKYRVYEKDYFTVLREWKNDKELKKAAHTEFDGKITPAMNKHFHDILVGIAAEKKIDNMSFNFDVKWFDDAKPQIDNALRLKLMEEIKIINIAPVELSIDPAVK